MIRPLWQKEPYCGLFRKRAYIRARSRFQKRKKKVKDSGAYLLTTCGVVTISRLLEIIGLFYGILFH